MSIISKSSAAEDTPRRELALPYDGRRRVFVSSVSPRLPGVPQDLSTLEDRRAEPTNFDVKRVLGDRLRVTADLVADGHDVVAGVVRHRGPGVHAWTETPLRPQGNDRFAAEIELDALGLWSIAVEGWVDDFASWAHGLERKVAAGAIEPADLATGAQLVQGAATRASGEDRRTLAALGAELLDAQRSLSERAQRALEAPTRELASRHADRAHATRTEAWRVSVDPVHARFAAWYELFPRSTGEAGTHGTFRTTEKWLSYVRGMGFDVLYLPPIHPIGLAFRKGKNNTLGAGPGEPGSPWAIGAPEGGHTAVHPELGTIEDFDHFVAAARAQGLQIALDIAFQASPDHPWVKSHPEWFRRRPDGSIQYAENPPKKYQDVYPFDFESEAWASLWRALRDVFAFWIDRGVTIFRVDNPHTKPISFWTWCIASLKAEHPEVTFLAEAFTRPKLKLALAKAGFSQGYTYFTWRTTRRELTEYLAELTQTEVVEYFRPSFWPNTPDILPDDLQFGGRPAFLTRLILAGTLSSHYGIYGPAFELQASAARPGSGEYLDNEKYELKHWPIDRPDSLQRAIAVLNRIRREHPALQRNDTLRFHPTDNELLLCYSKTSGEDLVVVVVNLDPHHRQSGWTALDLETLGLDPDTPYQAHDLLGGTRHAWRGPRNYVELDPGVMPAQIFAIRRKVRTERDFDYFM